MMTLDQGGFGRVDTQIIPPPPELAEIVEHAFIRRDHDAPRSAGTWRIVPDPSANLVVVVRATPHGRVLHAVLVGSRSRYADIDTSGRLLTLGVRLRPGALPAVTREPAAVLTDRAVCAEDVFGSSWHRVVDRFTEHDPHAALRQIIGVMRDAVRARRADRAVIAAAQGARSVAALAGMLAMPLRTLHDRTCDVIGFSPVRLLRILRIYRALEAHRRSSSWARVASSTGFADQPHLVREFRALLGDAPSTWLARGIRGDRAADPFKTS